MRFLQLLTAAASAALLVGTGAALARDPPTSLQIGVKHRPAEKDCVVKSQNGDKLSMSVRESRCLWWGVALGQTYMPPLARRLAGGHWV